VIGTGGPRRRGERRTGPGPHGRLRRALRERETLIGMGIVTPLPAAVEVAGEAGFDYVFIDLEHTAISLRELEGLLRAAELYDMASIVRVPENGEAIIRRVLELGADAVKVPHVTDADGARAAVRHARFPPEGARGTAGFVRSARYRAQWPEWLAAANDATCVDVMIEDVDALDRLDDILGVPGVDIVSFGQYDFSVSMGAPGAVADERVSAALDAVVAAAERHGQAVFTIVLPPTSIDAAAALAEQGVRLLTFGNEITHLHGTLTRIASEASERLGRTAAGGGAAPERAGSSGRRGTPGRGRP
jgi:4-hydroxy-2-oxoheptanedioate aldolase